MSDTPMPCAFVVSTFQRGPGCWVASGTVGTHTGDLSLQIVGLTEASARDTCSGLLAAAVQSDLLDEIRDLLETT